jgi:hypothetical protein
MRTTRLVTILVKLGIATPYSIVNFKRLEKWRRKYDKL